MPRWPKKDTEEISQVEEVPAETPVVVSNPYSEAKKHFVGKGSVSGEWLFDDVPGSITAATYEEALEKYEKTPGIYKVAGSH